jgi:hypothetical protein
MKATDENNNKTGERVSQGQQYIVQLYNCQEMLIIFILRHVSTLLSHLQVFLKNLRLFAFGSVLSRVARLRSHWLLQ